MAFVEDEWFSRWLPGAQQREPWGSADWTTDPDWDFTSAASDTPQELLTQWHMSVERSREGTSRALAADELGVAAKRSWPDGKTPTLRWILVHMIEEYARHNGHADFLRESIDGETGE